MNDLAFEAARALSMVAFFVYGLTCLVTDRMVAEFERYGLGALRKLTGLLEVAGSLGLLAGYFYPPLLVLSSGCLSLLMLFAVGARVRIRS